MLLVAVTSALVSGCESSSREQTGVDGYWKGQMVEQTITDQASTMSSRATVRPRRILLKLEESAGIVQGRFARSSDVVAFRQIGNDSSRRVTMHVVAGTLDGPRVRLSFSAEAGRTFQIDALVDKHVIVGSYVARHSTGRTQDATSGRFEIERF